MRRSRLLWIACSGLLTLLAFPAVAGATTYRAPATGWKVVSVKLTSSSAGVVARRSVAGAPVRSSPPGSIDSSTNTNRRAWLFT